MKLRSYQEDAVKSIFQYFGKGCKGNPVCAMPTGTGKSVVIGAFIRKALELYPGTRVMKLTHVKELIEQNFEKLLAIWPTAPAGIFSAGLKRKDAGHPIVFGGVASVAKATLEDFGRIDLLLVDECHLISPKESTMYQVIISQLKTLNPNLKVIGFTATHYRLGSGMITEAGGIFTDLCIDMTTREAFNWFIAEGYLSTLVPKRPGIELDLSGVHIHGGEYKQNELQDAVDKEEITFAAVKEMVAYGADRNHWLVFASGIGHAMHISSMLDSVGVPSTFVHSKMKNEDRDNAIADFKSGKFRAMVNNGILTTGFDFPGIDLIGMMRPTQSASLWVQMLGRGTRPLYAEGYDLSTASGRLDAIANGEKQNCLVLDFAGNTRRLGPINDPVLPQRKGKAKGGMAPVRICEVCGTYNHASVRFCSECGTEFPREIKINEYAGTDEIVAGGSKEPEPVIFKVDRVVYARHSKMDKPDSIRISYFCGLRIFHEYICLEHEGFASKKSRDLWRERANDEPPETTDEALAQVEVLKTPTHIWVKTRGKYDEVIGYDFSGSGFGTELAAR